MPLPAGSAMRTRSVFPALSLCCPLMRPNLPQLLPSGASSSLARQVGWEDGKGAGLGRKTVEVLVVGVRHDVDDHHVECVAILEPIAKGL